MTDPMKLLKQYKVQIKGKNITLFIDTLKPGFLSIDINVTIYCSALLIIKLKPSFRSSI